MKLLVLGSDFFALQAVTEAKKMGAYVIVTDLMETSPTKEAADEKWWISTADIDELERKCKEVGVTGVMYGASDFNVEKARILCKRLGLPIYCSGDKAWEASRNKRLFKDACKEVGAPVAQDYYISAEMTEEELAGVKFPVVVKPVDKNGNTGVSYCENARELKEAFLQAREISDNPTIIVEQKITGTEHHINYAVADGEIRLISYAESNHDARERANIYSFESNTSRFLKQYLEEVNDSLIEVFKRLGCREGIVWVDTMRDENDGKFYILEMGYRFAAAMASCALNERVTGFNPVKWMVECALGVQHKAEDLPAPLDCAHESAIGLAHYFVGREAVMGSVEGLEALMNMPDVSVDMPKSPGALIPAYGCVALIGIYGKDYEEMLEKLQYINSVFKVKDPEGKDILIYFKDYEGLREHHKQGLQSFGSAK